MDLNYTFEKYRDRVKDTVVEEFKKREALYSLPETFIEARKASNRIIREKVAGNTQEGRMFLEGWVPPAGGQVPGVEFIRQRDGKVRQKIDEVMKLSGQMFHDLAVVTSDAHLQRVREYWTHRWFTWHKEMTEAYDDVRGVLG